MKFLKKIINLSEASDVVHDVDSDSVVVGKYKVWLYAFSTNKDLVTELLLYVIDPDTNVRYKVEAYPFKDTSVDDIINGKLNSVETVSYIKNKDNYGFVVINDEDFEEFLNKIINAYIIKYLPNVMSNEINPDFSDEDETYSQRQDRMRQARWAREEADSDI
jgi:uncharacterized protein YlbG (UPF0298 family)